VAPTPVQSVLLAPGMMLKVPPQLLHANLAQQEPIVLKQLAPVASSVPHARLDGFTFNQATMAIL